MEHFDKVLNLKGLHGYDLPEGNYHFAVAYSGTDHLPEWFDFDSYLTGDDEYDGPALRGIWVGLRPLDPAVVEHYGLIIIPYDLFQDLIA